MRRVVAAAVLGVLTSVTVANAAGYIVVGNYVPPYNPVVWDASQPVVGGTPVSYTDGVTLTISYGKGQGAEALTQSTTATFSVLAEDVGFPGLFYEEVTLDDWLPGDVYSFQVRADGAGVGESVIWEEQGRIGSAPGSWSNKSIGFTVVPEPTTFTLLGLGSLALVMVRRRK